MDYKKIAEEAFNSFNGDNLESLDKFYAEDVEFIDPLVQVHGLKNLKSYYAQAYENVNHIRFQFQETIQENNKIGIFWVMTLNAKGLNWGKDFHVSGYSHLHFNKENKVMFHRDILDIGAMVYEKIPVVGTLVSVIKNKLRHGLSAPK